MKIISIDKPYSWLQWPVTLKGCKAPHLHVTAKFFGDAKINPFAVVELASHYHRLPLASEISWLPSIFHVQAHVLEFPGFPDFMRELHDEFAIIADQFEPWKPHVTVPRIYWIQVDSENLTPVQEQLTFGHLELVLGTATAGDAGKKESKK